MGDVLPLKPRRGSEADEAARRKRDRARPLITRWLKAIETVIREGRLSNLDGRLARTLTCVPSANDGVCWARQEWLAGALGRRMRTIRYSVGRLKAEGFLSAKQRGWNRSCLYTFMMNGRPLMPRSEGMSQTQPQEAAAATRGQQTPGKKLPPAPGKKLPPAPGKKLPPDPLESRDPLDHESPLPPSIASTADGRPSGEAARSGLPKEDGGGIALDGDVLSPDSITFRHFWEASGMVGLIGPALAAWEKLVQADRRAIAELILRDHTINTGGTWACTWLAVQAWKQPPLPMVDDRRDTERSAANDFLFGWKSSSSSGPPMLAPYSDEWQAERARRIARGKPTSLMDDWAKRGMGWPCV
jgi:hypothetical protein